jgi:hypothetical protein
MIKRCWIQLYRRFCSTAKTVLKYQYTTLILLFLLLAITCTALASEVSTEPVYEVVTPSGETTVKAGRMAPRLHTLAGKTVCMVWNRAFKADVTLPVIGEALKKQYPDLKIVPYTDMPEAFLPEPEGAPGRKSEALQKVFKEKGCDAVISGNGG